MRSGRDERPARRQRYSAEDLISLGFIHSPRHVALIQNTRPVSEIDVGKFDAIIVAGGQSPMFTLEAAHALHQKFVAFYEASKLAVALCHGVAILRYAKPSNGKYLASGKDGHGLRKRRRGLCGRCRVEHEVTRA